MKGEEMELRVRERGKEGKRKLTKRRQKEKKENECNIDRRLMRKRKKVDGQVDRRRGNINKENLRDKRKRKKV